MGEKINLSCAAVTDFNEQSPGPEKTLRFPAHGAKNKVKLKAFFDKNQGERQNFQLHFQKTLGSAQ